ncbi:Protein of unknown function [Pyronema omphalodes CBS 100304]|uniref:Uncharacterized protein n=1 Tax=Pyronema omphalodes (strain CBS 100304) TaxID=1076935 RepID=U4L382_PYROM|nr:Protein of unknown function [Pyronema omphalodes CBS 100304]
MHALFQATANQDITRELRRPGSNGSHAPMPLRFNYHSRSVWDEEILAYLMRRFILLVKLLGNHTVFSSGLHS